MEERADVGKARLHAVFRCGELRVVGVEQLEHLRGAVCGESAEGDLLLHAENLDGSRAGLAAGVDEGLRLGDSDIGVAALGADRVQEVQRTAGAAGIEHHDLTVRQGAVAALGDHAVRERRGDDHDEVHAGDGFRHIAGHLVETLVGGLAVKRQIDAVSGNDALKVLREQVTQIDLDAEAGKICGNGRTAVAGANDSNFFFHFVFASEMLAWAGCCIHAAPGNFCCVNEMIISAAS